MVTDRPIGTGKYVIGALTVNVDQVINPASLSNIFFDDLYSLIGQHRIAAVIAFSALPCPNGLVFTTTLLNVPLVLKVYLIVGVKIRIEFKAIPHRRDATRA